MAKATTKEFRLDLEGCPKPLVIRPTIAKKSGNVFWAVLAKKSDGSRYFPMYGLPISAQAENLPRSAVLRDPETGETVTVALAAETTEDGRPKVSRQVGIELPGTGEKKMLKVGISVTKDGRWNVKVVVNGISGGGVRASQDDDVLG